MTMLKPKTQVPELNVKTLGGGEWNLAAQTPENFTMIVFYRGYHCPICKPYIRDLDRKLSKFEGLGVNTIAVSSDALERARKTEKEWELENVTIGYDLSLETARRWGLYVSKAIRESEPAEFSEPGLFLIKPDGTLYAAAVQTMPFARPQFSELLNALQFVLNNDYPARGEA